MHWMWQDLRYGLRQLHKEPAFTFLAILTLALGIGAATTIFSVIHNVLLDPFPYVDTERVVSFQIRDSAATRPGGRSRFEVPEFLDYQEQTHVFEEVIGGGNEDVLYTTADGTEQFTGGYVTPNMFRFLGMPPQIGRTITPGDAKPGGSAGVHHESQDVVQALQPRPRYSRPDVRAERYQLLVVLTAIRQWRIMQIEWS